MLKIHSQINTQVAEAYEKYMVPGIQGAWADLVTKFAAPKRGEHVLDVACGTGLGARLAAVSVTSSGRIVGLDSDPGMIEVARDATRAVGIPMEWHCASALDMPFADATFDLCICLQGLQFFPDREAGLAEIRRVLKPSGRFVASIWAPLSFNKGHQALVEALERQKIDASQAKRPFSFAEPGQIHDTARRARFREIDLRTEEALSCFPSVQTFIDTMASGAPYVRRALALLPEEGLPSFLVQ
ncbi:MAG: class I SAM-dependent methyltransferase [Acidiferrobacterales bacterium]